MSFIVYKSNPKISLLFFYFVCLFLLETAWNLLPDVDAIQEAKIGNNISINRKEMKNYWLQCHKKAQHVDNATFIKSLVSFCTSNEITDHFLVLKLFSVELTLQIILPISHHLMATKWDKRLFHAYWLWNRRK